MSKGLASGRVVRSRTREAEHCLALSGKGAPTPADLERAIEAVTRTSGALRAPRLRGAHAFEPPAAEVRLRAPSPGARGGSGWTVFVPVPAWVTARDARAAAAEASEHSPLAKSIRLSPLVTDAPKRKSPPGRDKQPGQLRSRQTGPQHRARDLR